MSPLTAAATRTIPLARLPRSFLRRLRLEGGKPSDLHRALANHPRMLEAWTAFAWALRAECHTPRGLRELIILRVAQVTSSLFIWEYHYPLAVVAGIPQTKIRYLRRWRSAARFTAAERSALALAEAIVADQRSDDPVLDPARYFDASERVELALTAAFYQMVSRVVDAFGLTTEGTDGRDPTIPDDGHGRTRDDIR